MATGFDVIGLLLILVMAMSGLKKGLIDGVLKMVGVYAAIYASMNYNQYGTLFLEPLISIPDAYKVTAGFVLIFLVVMYSITFASFLLRKLVKTMHLGAIDRIGGISFGAIKAGLILSAVVWAFAMVPESMRGDWQKESRLYPIVEVFAANMVQLFSLEDELALLQTTVGSLMGQGKDKMLEQALGGSGDIMGGLDLDAITGMSGTGTLSRDGHSIIPGPGGLPGGAADIMQSEMMKKAMESLEGPQKEIIEQALQALQSGDANSLLEGAINSKDASGKSLMDEAMKYMDPTQKTDMHEMIQQMEAQIKTQQNR
ncbi:MAG: CvpA family protein [Candidatus Marinimicrobia bacterium]|nr:CvpA family protein [Candidatus Neomarinimicrobiota bacterium]